VAKKFEDCDHAERVRLPGTHGGTLLFADTEDKAGTPGTVEVCKGCGTFVVEFSVTEPGEYGFRFRLNQECFEAAGVPFPTAEASGWSADWDRLLLSSIDHPEIRAAVKAAVSGAVRRFFRRKRNE
jgi:hypothetical protein